MCFCIRIRFLLCFMIFTGHATIFITRNALSVAIMDMIDTGIIPKEIWRLPSQDVVLSSFYLLFAFSNLYAGSLALRIGSKTTFALGIGVSALVTLLMPLAAVYNYIYLTILRVLQGVFQGLSIATVYTIYGKWFPRSERSFLKSLCASGFSFASLVGHPITGYLCASNFLYGWPSSFYVFGFLQILYLILWCCTISESPSEHPWISRKELDYILDDQGQEHARKEIAVPWRSILKSYPVWSLVFSSVCLQFFKDFVRLDYPAYLRRMYNYDITQIGWLSMLPFALEIAVSLSAGFLADFIISRNPGTRKTAIRKCFNVAGCVPSVLALVVITQFGGYFQDPSVTVGLITAAYGLQAIDNAGSDVGTIELSPVFAGTLYGIVNVGSTVTAFVSPLLVGAVTAGKQSSREAWNIVFYMAMVAVLVQAVVYVTFGSADLQPWGLGEKNVTKKVSNKTYSIVSNESASSQESA